MATAAQPGMPVSRCSPFGMRESGASSGHGRSEGDPIANITTLITTKAITSPQKGVHEASAEPPSVPEGSARAAETNMLPVVTHGRLRDNDPLAPTVAAHGDLRPPPEGQREP